MRSAEREHEKRPFNHSERQPAKKKIQIIKRISQRVANHPENVKNMRYKKMEVRQKVMEVRHGSQTKREEGETVFKHVAKPIYVLFIARQ